MTIHTFNIRSTNLPSKESSAIQIESDSQAYIMITDVKAYYSMKISPIFSEQAVSPILTRLAEVLPVRMSKTHIEQLRMHFPQPAATDDPATYEFEAH
jgi:hypothetical protein